MDGVMNSGLRKHKGSSLRIAIPIGFPQEVNDKTREVLNLVSDNKNRGEASNLMWTICAEADMAGMGLVLTPADEDEKLKKFYKKFGFEEIQQTPCIMMRFPETPRIARVN